MCEHVTSQETPNHDRAHLHLFIVFLEGQLNQHLGRVESLCLIVFFLLSPMLEKRRLNKTVFAKTICLELYSLFWVQFGNVSVNCFL